MHLLRRQVFKAADVEDAPGQGPVELEVESARLYDGDGCNENVVEMRMSKRVQGRRSHYATRVRKTTGGLIYTRVHSREDTYVTTTHAAAEEDVSRDSVVVADVVHSRIHAPWARIWVRLDNWMPE